MPDFDYPYDVRNLPPAPPIQLRPVAESSPSSIGWWLASFAFGFAALNFLFLPVIWAVNSAGPISPRVTLIAAYVAAFSFGTMGAGPGLLSIAAVFGPGTAWHRHLLAVSAVLLLVLSGAVSIFCVEKARQVSISPGGQIWPCVLLMPILFCACQLPLWPFRSIFCWRIAKEHVGTSEPAPRLTITGILAATAVIAVSLAAVRFGRDSLSFLVGAQADSRMWWFLTGIWAAVIATISIAFLPVFTIAILRTKSLLLGVSGAGAWSALLFVASIVITRLVCDGWPFPFPWHWPAAIVAGFTVSLGVPLMVVRYYDYRLLWGKGG